MLKNRRMTTDPANVAKRDTVKTDIQSNMKKAKRRICRFKVPYSNRISPWLIEFGLLPWQTKQTVSALACHIGGPNYVNTGQVLLVFGTQKLNLKT